MRWPKLFLGAALALTFHGVAPAQGAAPPLKVLFDQDTPPPLVARFFPANGEPPLLVSAEGGEKAVAVPGLCGRQGTLVLEGPHVISEPLAITLPGPCELSARWFPKALVTANLVGQGPGAGRLQLVTPDLWPEVVTEYPVEIGEKGQVLAPVPAGSWYVRLVVPDRVPVSWGLQTLAPNEQATLPQASLHSGPYLAMSLGFSRERKPVAGVRVWCVPEEERERLWCGLRDPKGPGGQPAVSDGSGWAVCRSLKAGQRYAVGALLPENVPWLINREPLEPQTGVWEVPVPLSATVTVHLRDALRDFPLGPRVQLRAEMLPNGLTRCPLEAVFHEGQASLTGVGPGDYTLMVTLQVLGETVTLRTKEISVFPGEDRHLEADLGNVLAGRVEGAGERPICMLKPYLWEQTSLKHMAPALTDAKGFFLIPLAVGGTWAFEVRCLDFRTFLPKVQVEPGEFLNLQLPKGRIRGRVLDRAGLPIGHRRVSITPARVEGANPLVGNLLAGYLFVLRETTDDGRFEFSHLPAGTYRLEAHADGKGSGRASRKEVRLEDGQTLEVELSADPAPLTVVFYGTEGPVAGAQGYAFPVPESDELSPGPVSFEADATGKAELVWPTESAPRWVHLTVYALPFYPAQAFRIEVPRALEHPEPIRLVLQRGAGGFVEVPKPAEVATYLRTADGAVLCPIPGLQHVRKPSADGPPNFLLGPILPGRYEVIHFPVSPQAWPQLLALLRGQPVGGQWVWIAPETGNAP